MAAVVGIAGLKGFSDREFYVQRDSIIVKNLMEVHLYFAFSRGY